MGEKQQNEVEQAQEMTPEQKAQFEKEKARQEALLKKVKSKDQIQKEMEERLKAAAGSKGVAVAAALASSIQSAAAQPKGPKIIRKFEITLYEEDEDDRGQIIQKVVNGGKPEIIEACSQADLNEKLSLYRQCGQIPRCKPIGQPMIEKPDGTREPYDGTARASEIATSTVREPIKPSIAKRPAKYYKIGGIEVKNDNGKIYQKQWMKLSEAEAKNIRIVNDKTNAIVNLNGKHFEMMKWILVEDSESDETTSLEEILNG